MTVVVNHDTGAVVWCAKGHGRKVFDSFFGQLTEEQRAAIELVSGDGARWIDEAIAEWCPQAARCVDTFHVVGWATDALDEVRKQAWREANAKAKERTRGDGRPREGADKEAARAVKGLRYPLLKNPEDLTERQAADLEMAAMSNPRLYRAYLLKEGLRLALKLPPGHRAQWYERLVKTQRRTILSSDIESHQPLATAEHGITNARVESVNNGIKLIVRMAYGYRNFDNLRAMVMLKHSGLPIELPGRTAKEKEAA